MACLSSTRSGQTRQGLLGIISLACAKTRPSRLSPEYIRESQSWPPPSPRPNTLKHAATNHDHWTDGWCRAQNELPWAPSAQRAPWKPKGLVTGSMNHPGDIQRSSEACPGALRGLSFASQRFSKDFGGGASGLDLRQNVPPVPAPVLPASSCFPVSLAKLPLNILARWKAWGHQRPEPRASDHVSPPNSLIPMGRVPHASAH